MADIRGRMTVVGLVAAILCPPAACAAPPQSVPLEGRGPIQFVDGADTSYGRQMEALVERWNRQREYLEKVTFVEMPNAADKHRAQLRARAQTSTDQGDPARHPPCYDVITMDVTWTAEFARDGYVVPLDSGEFDMASFLTRPVEAVTLDGKTWAVPHRSDAGLLYYRKDMLDAFGYSPPRTWAELATQAATIAASRDNIAGYVGQFDHYEGLTVNVLEAIWSHGGDILTPGGEVVGDAPQAKAGVRMLADGFGSGPAAGWIPRAALKYDEERSRTHFQDGRAVFLRNWPYAYRRLAETNSAVHDTFAVGELPGPSALGGWNLAISSCSQNRRTAAEFIRFVTSEENQRLLFDMAGLGPTRASVYRDPGLRQRFPYLDVLRKSIENSRNRPSTPHYDDVSSAIQEYLFNALNTPESAEVMTERLADVLAAIVPRR